MSIIQKYSDRVKKTNSLVCIGLDSEISKIPQLFRSNPMPQFTFNKWIIDQTHACASAFKPNLAFYEARGEQGVKELKLTLEYIQEQYPDIFLIADAKRADIGNTNEGYIKSIFDWYGFDAVTLHPYLGKEALQPFLDRTDKGCIILSRTSNSGAGEIQDLLVDGKPIWQIVSEKVRDEWNTNDNCMIVVGATYPKELAVMRRLMGEMTFLVPGIGAQGGDVRATIRAGLNSKKEGMIINSSRGIIFSINPAEEAKKLKDEINRYRH